MFVAVFLALGAAAVQAATYTHVPTPYAWIDPTGHTAATWSNPTQCTGFGDTIGDDAITAPINLGFTFNYGGTGYTQLQIMTNGRLQFGQTYCGAGTQNTGPPRTYTLPYPDGNIVRTMKVYGPTSTRAPTAPGGARPTTCTAPGCAVLYATLGSAPSRTFIVTWLAVPDWSSTGSFYNLQIILHEDGSFAYQFGASNNLDGGHADIGWELATNDFDTISYTDIGSIASTAILFFDPLLPTATPTVTGTPTSTPTVTPHLRSPIPPRIRRPVPRRGRRPDAEQHGDEYADHIPTNAEQHPDQHADHTRATRRRIRRPLRSRRAIPRPTRRR